MDSEKYLRGLGCTMLVRYHGDVNELKYQDDIQLIIDNRCH